MAQSQIQWKLCNQKCGRPVDVKTSYKTCCRNCAIHQGTPRHHDAVCDVRAHGIYSPVLSPFFGELLCTYPVLFRQNMKIGKKTNHMVLRTSIMMTKLQLIPNGNVICVRGGIRMKFFNVKCVGKRNQTTNGHSVNFAMEAINVPMH